MINDSSFSYSPLILSRRIAKLRASSALAKAKLDRVGNLRLWTVGIFLVLLGIGSAKPSLKIEFVAVPIFFILFPIQVKITRNRRGFWQSLESLIIFLERQSLRLQGKAAAKSSPKSSKGGASIGPTQDDEPEADLKMPAADSALGATSHLPLIRDLGVFGPHSLFTLVDETFTSHGKRDLLSWMNPIPKPLYEIQARQKQIQSLRNEAWFFTRLTLIADQARAESVDLKRLKTEDLLEFIKTPFLPQTFHRNFAITILLFILMLANVVLWSFGVGPSPVLLVLLFAGMDFWALGETGPTFQKGVGLDLHLSVLEPIFKKIEDRAPYRQKLQSHFAVTARQGPARQARRLSLIMIVLGVQTNPLLSLIANIFLPWSMVGNFLLENQRRRLEKTLPACIDELAKFESLGSLVLLDRYQTKTYPQWQDSSAGAVRLEAKGLYHPLINRERVVANDFAFAPGKRCGLLTGSNMAGKSTFLRTIGINQILAQMGAPVFADSLKTSPLKIETCIEVSDSLRDGFSYFYAEVRRLRDLLKSAQDHCPTLYLIDEIFRGTNNRERHIGSKSVIQQLANEPNALGFVSTHDLELASLETDKNAIENLHFREDFESGTMVFHYRLKTGPCPSSNALKIMQAEGIVISEE